MQKQKIYGLMFFALVLNASVAFSQVGDSYYTSKTRLKATYVDEIAADKYGYEVMQDSEFEQAGQLIYKPFNPLLVNGKQLDYRTFSLFSEGILTVLDSNPHTNDAKPILFYASIRRDGKILEDKKMRFLNKKLDKIDLAEIFAFARYGDSLILKPVKPEHWRAKRILRLIGGGC
jgi:hypothetical protein